MTHSSQCEIILRTLEKNAPSWVAMPVLVDACGGYAVHSRVSELRKRGHRVENRIERDGQAKRSFYRLAEEWLSDE